MDRHDRDVAEQWFRRRGLPAVVRGKPAQLLVRIVPGEVFLLLFLGFAAGLAAILDRNEEELDRLMHGGAFALFALGMLVCFAVLPPLGAWLAAKWVRVRVLDRRGTATAAVVAAFFVVVNPVVDWLTPPYYSLPGGFAVQVGLLVVLLVAAFFGGGSILGWALRAAFRQLGRLGDLTSRALPLLLLFTVFGFFTTELWQVAAELSRHQMWLVVGLFSVIAILFLMSTLSDEVHSLTGTDAVEPEPGKLVGTPFADGAASGAPTVPLRKLERWNLVLVLVLTQILQTLVLSVLTFVFFVVFGMITIKDSVIKAWVTHDPTTGKLFGFEVPAPNELLQVSLFIAAFSALYFAAAAVTDSNYRRSFFDPLVRHMATSLLARDVYLSRLPRKQRDPEVDEISA
ncbi:hypothetical protein [Amycolatopsis sp. CA-230715]|uniref:hypothetical protein n=1 Tax=Amycolatopsis sp. CA-230715 TaxID=2745196 RepID=UPI001C0249E4|nr:hypothetical protein [Amycolatopsis sp. CA-230715]QWF83266.1 hypothetical protein HUW46_06706 [Amycolatopsis sp. CA-230715]